MDKKQIKESIIGFLILILVAFVSTYLGASDPIFFISDLPTDNSKISDDKEGFFTLDLYNKGDQMGLAKICFSSDEFVLKGDYGVFEHRLCFNEFKVPPKESELFQPFKIPIKPNKTYIELMDGATIVVDIECSQKIWGLISKKCDNIHKSYNYLKDYRGFIRIL